MTVFVAAHPTTPMQAVQEDRSKAQRELIARMRAPRFISPNGDEAWGRKIYEVGLGLEYCTTDGMTDGWLKAAEPEVNQKFS